MSFHFNDYPGETAQQQLQRCRYELANAVREWLNSAEPFMTWLQGFEPDDVVGLAGIPDRDPVANFVKAKTGYDCVLRSEGRALWARDEVWAVSTEAEGILLPPWVSRYCQAFETWKRGRQIKAGECLQVLRAQGG